MADFEGWDSEEYLWVATDYAWRCVENISIVCNDLLKHKKQLDKTGIDFLDGYWNMSNSISEITKESIKLSMHVGEIIALHALKSTRNALKKKEK